MKAVVRIGDRSTGHVCWPPTRLSTGSPNVYANGIPIGEIGERWIPHTCKAGTHTEICVEGSESVYANGVCVSRIGDKLMFGEYIAEGSPNVFVGGKGSLS